MSQETLQNHTELQGFVDEDNLSKRQQRIRDAVLYYNIEDMTQQEIADEIGVTRPTVSGYLNSEEAQQFEPFFSSKRKAELKEWLEREFWKAYKASNEAFETIKNDDQASPQTRVRAAKELIENQDRLANWFQEVGLIEKPKERKEVEQKQEGPAEVNISMDLVEDTEEVQKHDKEEVEAQ